jgi:hypothetical protein
MDGTKPVAPSTLSVNVLTAPGKAMVGERPKPFGEALRFDPITSTLIFGSNGWTHNLEGRVGQVLRVG